MECVALCQIGWWTDEKVMERQNDSWQAGNPLPVLAPSRLTGVIHIFHCWTTIVSPFLALYVARCSIRCPGIDRFLAQ